MKALVIAELNPPLDVTLVTDLDGLKEVSEFLRVTPEFGFDTETNIVKSLIDRKIRTIQVGTRTKQYVIDLFAFAQCADAMNEQGFMKTPDWAASIVDALRPALESRQHLKVGTSLRFDYQVARWCLGLRTSNLYDCKLAERVLWAGHTTNFFSTSLEDTVLRYCKLQIDKTNQKTFDLTSPLTKEQIEYAALDTRLALAVRSGQLPFIEKYGLAETVAIENKAIPAFASMHIHGIYLNPTKWAAQIDAVKLQHAQNVAELDTHFIPRVGAKIRPVVDTDALEASWKEASLAASKYRPVAGEYNALPDLREKRDGFRKAFQQANRDIKAWDKDSLKWEGQAAINYGAPAQILTVLQEAGFKIKDTNDKTLDKLPPKPIIVAIRNFRETRKLLDTYGMSFLDNINPITGRVHSEIDQLGAETGRTSSKNPNVQNIPRDPVWRACFTARPGYKIITRDYDGCELRIMAEESGETVWIDAFNAGQDVHSVCAELLEPIKWKEAALPDCAYYTKNKAKCKCPLHKAIREGIKAVNFGIPYGMEKYALAAKLHITPDEAQDLLDKHAAAFKKVHAYLKKSGDQAKINLESRTRAGRRRIFEKPDWNRAAEKAAEWALEKIEKGERAPGPVTSKEVGRVYFGWWGAMEREGKNSPIQGGNADMAKDAMGELVDPMWDLFGAYFINMVHDELVVECPEQHVDACNELMDMQMAASGAKYVHCVPMTSDGRIKDYWAK